MRKVGRMYGMMALGLILGLGLAAPAAALTAREVIERVEENQVHGTMMSEGVMRIRDRFGSREKTFRLWAAGAKDMLIEFTNPEERGQKILRLGDEIYLYFPAAEEIIRLQGAALRDSVLGSDLSYEDMTGERSLLDDYTPTGLETVELQGRRHYLITLEGKRRGVAYPKQKVWVDAELFVPARAEYYSLSDRLLKEMETTDVRQIAGKNVPTRFVMEDKMKRDSRTEFRMLDPEIDVRLPAGIFSLEELSW